MDFARVQQDRVHGKCFAMFFLQDMIRSIMMYLCIAMHRFALLCIAMHRYAPLCIAMHPYAAISSLYQICISQNEQHLLALSIFLVFIILHLASRHGSCCQLLSAKTEKPLGFRMYQNVMFALRYSFQLTVKSNVRYF